MVNCENCMHYEVCELKIPAMFLLQESKECKHFKDKSHFIELPCKVGDKVYRPSKYLGVVQFVITSFEMYQSEMFFTDDSENIIYLPDIGKTVFLTYEEAEEKL